MPLPEDRESTIADIYALPEGKRAELIDGQIYDMAPPNYRHQKIVYQLGRAIGNFIESHGGDCEVLPAPFAVFLNRDEFNYVEPDLSVICDKGKLEDRGCSGAPDWVIEVASPGTERMDYGVKLFKYHSAGVREYWVVNPAKDTVNVFDFERDEFSNVYGFEDIITGCIYQDFEICIAELIKST